MLRKLEKTSHLTGGRKVKYTNPTFVSHFELTTAPRSNWRRWCCARRFSAAEQVCDWLAGFTWEHCLQEILCFICCAVPPSYHHTKPNIFIVKKWNKIQNIYQIYEENMWIFIAKFGLSFLHCKTSRSASFVDKITVSPRKTGCDI